MIARSQARLGAAVAPRVLSRLAHDTSGATAIVAALVSTVLIGFVGGSAFADEPVKGLLLSFALGLALVGAIEVGRRVRLRLVKPATEPSRLVGATEGRSDEQREHSGAKRHL